MTSSGPGLWSRALERAAKGLPERPGFSAAPVGLRGAHISNTGTQKDFSFTSNFICTAWLWQWKGWYSSVSNGEGPRWHPEVGVSGRVRCQGPLWWWKCSVPCLYQYLVVTSQDVPIGENWAKGTRDFSIPFLTITCESILFSKQKGYITYLGAQTVRQRPCKELRSLGVCEFCGKSQHPHAGAPIANSNELCFRQCLGGRWLF